MRSIQFLTVIVFTFAAQLNWAVEVVANGSFETNGGAGSSGFGNWTVVNHPLSNASRFYAQTGARAQFAKFDVPATTFGNFTAMSDQPSPGATAIYQNVSVPATGETWVQMRLFILNQVPEFSPQASLDPTIEGNQQVRVDVMTTSSAAFDVGAGVLLNVFKTDADFPRERGYFPVAIDLQPYAGQTVRIRIAEVDTRHGLLVGVDDVRVTNVPPATCAPVRPREGGASCNLDIDGDGLLSATDGLLIVRKLLGFSGNGLIDGASFNACATRTSVLAVGSALDDLIAAGAALDLDADGAVIANTDGLMLQRALRGLKQLAVTSNAIGSSATRTDWEPMRIALNASCLAALTP
jgi:hypothetical protein